MHAGCDDDGSAHSDLFLPRLEVSDDNHPDIVSSYGLRELSFAYAVLVLIYAQLLEQTTTVGVRVRVAVRHVYFIVVVRKRHLELE